MPAAAIPQSRVPSLLPSTDKYFHPTGLHLVNGIAKTTFDGKGSLSQVDAVAINGGMAPGWRPGTGTYSVNPDCTGTMTLLNEGMAPLELQILVAQSGQTIHRVVIDPGVAVTSDAEPIRTPKREN